MDQKILNLPFDIKGFKKNGTFEGYASVFNDLDSSQDRVIKGAFKNTLEKYRQNGRMPALLWQHDAGEPIGVWREMFEDQTGLYVKGELFVEEIPRARQAYKLMREGGLSGLSIGFKTIQSELNPKTGERLLTEIDLLEVSMVTFPALDSARVSGVKASLNAGILPNEREFEAFLREAGFSRKQAKGVIAGGYKNLSQREAGQENNMAGILYELSAKIRGLV
jgi:HK97 family phage prohead protease